MSKSINFSIFLDKLEDYENIHALWCAKLIAIGRQTLQSVYDRIDFEQLMNLTDSFLHFISLLSNCHSIPLSDDKKSIVPIEQTLKNQNESQELLPKKDIIKLVNNELQCPICNEWLFRATSANCNHTFCETCIKKWLKINKTCPVCRSSIQYTSTSIAVDNFISNLCQLFGGFFKERRESIQNASIVDDMEQTNDGPTIDELMNDSSISQLIQDNTYISDFEISTTGHPNRVRLIPHPRSPSTVSRFNSRQATVTSNSLNFNRVPLIHPPRLPVSSRRGNQGQPTTLTSVVNSRVNRFQFTSPTSVPSSSNLRRPFVQYSNIAQLSHLSIDNSRNNRLQSPSSTSIASPVRSRTNTNTVSSSRNQSNSLRPQN